MIFLEIFNVPDKMKQPLIAGIFVLDSLFYQHVKIGSSCFSCCHGRYHPVISGILIHLVNQFMYRQIYALPAQLLQKSLKPNQLLRQLIAL